MVICLYLSLFILSFLTGLISWVAIIAHLVIKLIKVGGMGTLEY
jgi:hypothetical protein